MCQMDLRKLPFDTQVCSINILSRSTNQQVQGKLKLSISRIFPEHEWSLQGFFSKKAVSQNIII